MDKVPLIKVLVKLKEKKNKKIISNSVYAAVPSVNRMFH